MAAFSVNWSKTNTASATVPMGVLTGGTTRRLKLYEINVGSDATPADNAASNQIMRTTARGTQSTTVTPNPIDPADPAAVATFDTAWSVNPTITASSQLLQWGQNQRASFRWVCAPGKELVCPATSANGLAHVVLANGGSAVNTNFSWEYDE